MNRVIETRTFHSGFLVGYFPLLSNETGQSVPNELKEEGPLKSFDDRNAKSFIDRRINQGKTMIIHGNEILIGNSVNKIKIFFHLLKKKLKMKLTITIQMEQLILLCVWKMELLPLQKFLQIF